MAWASILCDMVGRVPSFEDCCSCCSSCFPAADSASASLLHPGLTSNVDSMVGGYRVSFTRMDWRHAFYFRSINTLLAGQYELVKFREGIHAKRAVIASRHRTGLSTCQNTGPVKETPKKQKKPDSLCQTLKSRKLAAARQMRTKLDAGQSVKPSGEEEQCHSGPVRPIRRNHSQFQFCSSHTT